MRVLGLSNKQREVLVFIQSYFKKNKQSPTIEEIAVELGVTSKGTVAEHLSALEKKGAIRRVVGAFRGIILNESDSGFVEIPLLGVTAAGKGVDEKIDGEVVQVPKKFVSDLTRHHFALKVKGDSMQEDGVYNDEIIIVEQRSTADNGDLVVADTGDGRVTLKYFYRERDRIRLEPRNKNYAPMFFDGNNEGFNILGIFKGITTASPYPEFS